MVTNLRRKRIVKSWRKSIKHDHGESVYHTSIKPNLKLRLDDRTLNNIFCCLSKYLVHALRGFVGS